MLFVYIQGVQKKVTQYYFTEQNVRVKFKHYLVHWIDFYIMGSRFSSAKYFNFNVEFKTKTLQILQKYYCKKYEDSKSFLQS